MSGFLGTWVPEYPEMISSTYLMWRFNALVCRFELSLALPEVVLLEQEVSGGNPQ